MSARSMVASRALVLGLSPLALALESSYDYVIVGAGAGGSPLAAKLAKQEKIREEANTILADAKAEANQLKAEAEKKFLEKLSPAITKIQAAEKEKAAAMDAQTLAEGKLKDASKGKEAKAAEKALAEAKLKVDAANKLIFVAAGEGIALQVRRRPCSVWPLP